MPRLDSEMSSIDVRLAQWVRVNPSDGYKVTEYPSWDEAVEDDKAGQIMSKYYYEWHYKQEHNL